MERLLSQIMALIRMFKNQGGYFVTTFINSSIPLLFLPVLTRYLEPAEYANIALFNFYLALSNSLSGTSIPVVISKNFFDQSKEYIGKIIGNSIRIVFFFSLFTSIIIAIFYRIIATYLDLPLIWLLLIPWGSFFYIIFSMALTVHRNEKKMLVFSAHKIGNTVINILISLTLVVVLMWGWQGRVIGVLVSYFFSAILALYYLKRNNYINFSFSKKLTKNILKVVIPLISNAFQSVIIAQIGIFFIQLYFAKEILGIYSVAYQISYFIHLLFITISFSWSPYVYEQISKPEKMNLLRLTKLYYGISLLLLLGVVFVTFFSDLILRIFTTQNYFAASEFIPWLALGVFFNGLYVFLLPILMKKEKQKAVSIISLINMIIMLGLNVLFIDLYGYMGVAYAFCATYLLMFIPLAILTHKSFPLPWFNALKILSNRKQIIQ